MGKATQNKTKRPQSKPKNTKTQNKTKTPKPTKPINMVVFPLYGCETGEKMNCKMTKGLNSLRKAKSIRTWVAARDGQSNVVSAGRSMVALPLPLRTRPSTKVPSTQREVPNPHAAHTNQWKLSKLVRTDPNTDGHQKLSKVKTLLENCSGKSTIDEVQTSTQCPDLPSAFRSLTDEKCKKHA